MTRANALACAALFVAACCAGCGGGGGVPSGSVVNDPPSPAPTTSFLPATVNVTIVVPSATQQARRRPAYLSTSTQSVAIQLVSVAGTPVSSQAASTVNTYAGAPNCGVVGGTSALSCSGTVAAATGTCVFSVTTYAQPNATGAILSAGTLSADTTTNTNLRLDSTDTSPLSALVASVSLALTPARVTLGTAQSMQLTVSAQDASGAIIVGPGTYANPIALSIVGDSKHAFSFAGGTTSYQITAPGAGIAVQYNGDATIGTRTITLHAQTLGATAPVSSDTPIIVLPSPSPPPTPTPSPTATPSPPSTYLYVLNGGGAQQQSITEYTLNANGNVAPSRTLLLASRTVGFTVYAPVSMAVDANGYVYVGFSSGFTDPGNEIDVYAPGASGAATPLRRIAGSTSTQLNPQVIAVDSTGRTSTLVQTNVDRQNPSTLSMGVYVSGAAGSAAPSHAWTLSGQNTFGAAPNIVEATVDGAGNVSIVGQLSDANGNPTSSGVFVAPSSAWNGGVVAPARVIPADAITTLISPAGVTRDSSGTLYVADAGSGSIDLWPAGPTGTTDVPPSRVFSNAGLSASAIAPLAFSGTSVYALEPQTPSVVSFAASAQGQTAPLASIAGSRTGLQFPLAIAVGPSISGSNTAGKYNRSLQKVSSPHAQPPP